MPDPLDAEAACAELRAAWVRIRPADAPLSFEDAMARPPLAALIRWAAAHPEALRAGSQRGRRACNAFHPRASLFTQRRACRPKQLKLL
jgi:hypothetical protein